MAGREERNIIEALRNAAGNNNQFYPVEAGIIIDVDESAATAIVQMTLDDESSPTEGVLLNVVEGNKMGILLIPKKGANCILVAVDGPAMYQMIWASEYEKASITISDRKLEVKEGNWIFDNGNNGTVPISSKTAERLNIIEQDINSLKQDFLQLFAQLTPPATPVTNGTLLALLQGAFASYAGQQLQETQASDIENEKIKH